jgi:hypothetical protein
MRPSDSGSIVDVGSLPDFFPTHRHTSAFWEALGRTVGTFGFLEEILAKAIFALTATTEIPGDRIDEEFERWGSKLERAISDPMGPLIDTYAKALTAHSDATIENQEQLIEDLRYAARIRNVLCHGSWGVPDVSGRSVPLFVDKKLQKFDTAIDAEKLDRIRTGAVELACSVISSVTHMGWQFPGSSGPGERIWPQTKPSE